MAVWFSGIGFASWKLLEPFRGPLVVSPHSSVHSEGHTSPVRGSDPRHDVHRRGGQRQPRRPGLDASAPSPSSPSFPAPLAGSSQPWVLRVGFLDLVLGVRSRHGCEDKPADWGGLTRVETRLAVGSG